MKIEQTLKQRQYLIPFLFLLLPLLLVSNALVGQQFQEVEMGRPLSFMVKNWTSDQGLPQNSITDILQTEDGYIWLATYGGLVRFDGINFELFDIGRTPGLGSNRLVRLFEDEDNILWILHEDGGITRHSKGRFQPFGVGTVLENLVCGTIIQDDAGVIWFGTAAGLMSYQDGRVEQYSGKERLSTDAVGNLFLLSDGSLLMSTGIAGYTDKTIVRMKEGHVEELARHSLGKGQFTAVMLDDEERFWTSGEGSLYGRSFKEDSMDTVQFNFPQIGYIKNLYRNQASYWIGTNTGLYLYDAGSRASEVKKIFDGDVKCLFQDEQENLWVGTDGDGLFCLMKQPVERFTVPDYFTVKSFDPVAADAKGDIWAGSRCGGLLHFTGDSVKHYMQPKGCIGALTYCEKGFEGMLVGYGNKLILMNDSGESMLTEIGGLTYGNAIKSLFVSRDSIIWIGTIGKGLFTYDGDTLIHFSAARDFLQEEIIIINQLANGNMVVGANAGLGIITSDSCYMLTERDGLTAGSIRSLYEDENEVLWTGSYGGGLTRIEGDQLTKYTINEGLAENVVSRIREDDKGRLWMMGNSGLSLVSKRALNDFAAGMIGQVSHVLLGTGEGMMEGNGGGFVATDSHGYTWWPTIDGIARINLNQFQIDSIPPKLRVAGVKIANQAVRLPSDTIHLQSDERDLELFVTGFDYSAPEKVRYSHFLEGYDSKWIENGDSRRINYTNLDPGSYRLMIKASNHYNIWSQTVVIPVFVEPQIWQRFYIRVLGVLILIWGFYGLFRWRVAFLLKRKNDLERIVKERTWELEELNRHLEDKVKERTKDLKERNKRLEEFSFINAHLLRGPVTRVQTLVNLLDEMDFKDDVDALDILKKSMSEIDEVILSINDALRK